MAAKKNQNKSGKYKTPQPRLSPRIPPLAPNFSPLSVRHIPPPGAQRQVLADLPTSGLWVVNGNGRRPRKDRHRSVAFLGQRETSALGARKGAGVEEDAALGASLCL